MSRKMVTTTGLIAPLTGKEKPLQDQKNGYEAD
jgi:hypothetical protein